jgi:DNA-binding beta-propeller fold protein YncE
MAASESFLFVASPSSGDVSILDVRTQRVIGIQHVGSDPGCIVVTPGEQYALVLNRKSGDVAVLRCEVAPNRYKERRGKLLTVIPVGSKPVSAAVRGV